MPKKPFVDFRDIRARITMEQVLEHYKLLGTFKRNGQSLTGPCPIHKGTNKTQFRVETEKNLWKCFSECKHGGNTLDFIAKMENVSIHDAAIKACEWFNIPFDEVKTESSSNEPEQTPRRAASARPAAAPKADDTKPNPPLKFNFDKRVQREHPYLINERGLTLETIIDFGLGFFTGERGMMVGYIVIPINNVKGELVAYAGCWPGEPPDQDTPKYKIPAGFKKSQEVFNLDRARQEPGPLVIVRDFFDAIKIHQHGHRKVVALMDNLMSAAQEELIRQHTDRQSHIIVMLGDNAARKDIAGRLSEHCPVKTHVFDQPNAAPEHLSPAELEDIVGGFI